MRRAFIFFCFSLAVFWFASKAHAVEINDPWGSYPSEKVFGDIWNDVGDDDLAGTGHWYSDTISNRECDDHFVAFEVPVAIFPQGCPGGEEHRLFMPAIEDLSMGGRDSDDLVVLMNAVAPSPVPGTMILLGIGLVGLGGLRRRFIR